MQNIDRTSAAPVKRASSMRLGWVIGGVFFVTVVAFLFKPIQTKVKIRSELQKWKSRVDRHLARMPRELVPMKIGSVPGSSAVPTSISSNMTLTVEKSPWLIAEDTTILSGATLTLEPGVRVLLGNLTTLFVFGALQAEGTKLNPVRFDALSDTLPWGGIFWGGDAAPSRLGHVEFSHAQFGLRPVHAKVTIEHSVMRNLREVCSAALSDTVFRNCLVQYHDFQVTGNINVFKFFKGTMMIEDSEIYCPETDLKIDAIDVDGVRQGVIRGNRLHGSTCQGADGIDIGVGSQNVLIEGNLISDLMDKGVSAGEKASVVISNNVIVRCGMGVGVKDGAQAVITHTTLVGNGVGVRCFEKVPGEGGGHASVRFSVFADNTNAPVSCDDLSTLTVTRSWSEAALPPDEGNMTMELAFENPPLNRYALVEPSSSESAPRAVQSPSGWTESIVPGAGLSYPEQEP